MFLGSLALLPAGCIDFDKELCVFIHRPDRDEAVGLVIYEGLHVAGKGRPDLESAQEALRHLVISKDVLFFGHPIFGVDLTVPDPGKKPSERDEQFRALLRGHVTVRDAGLFLAKSEKLNGYQIVHIRAVTEFLKDCNDYCCAEVIRSVAQQKADTKKTKAKVDDPELLAVMEKAAREGHRWIRLEPGRVNVDLPGSPELYKAKKRSFLEEGIASELNLQDWRAVVAPPVAGKSLKSGAQKASPTISPEMIRKTLQRFDRMAAYLSEAPLSVEQRADRLTIAVGYGGDVPLRVSSPYYSDEPGNKAAELLAYAQTLKAKWKTGLTIESLIGDFEKEHASKDH